MCLWASEVAAFWKVVRDYRRAEERQGSLLRVRELRGAKVIEADILMLQQLREIFPKDEIIPEYKFMPNRKFRFDFAIPKRNLAIERDGGVWTQGRHTRGAGFLKDMEKLNLAVAFKWRVLRFSTQQVLDGSALAFLREWFSPLAVGAPKS